MSSQILDNLSKKITNTIPTSIKILQSDLKKNGKSALESSLSRLNLVTREEFDIQQGVLQRSRQKIDQLEKQLAEIESQVADLIKK